MEEEDCQQIHDEDCNQNQVPKVLVFLLKAEVIPKQIIASCFSPKYRLAKKGLRLGWVDENGLKIAACCKHRGSRRTTAKIFSSLKIYSQEQSNSREQSGRLRDDH